MASLKICENEHVVEGIDQYYCPQCGSVDLVPADAAGQPIDPSAPASPTPAGAPVGAPEPAAAYGPERAATRLRSLLVWGTALYVTSVLLGALAVESLLDDLAAGDPEHGAEVVVLVISGLAATAGLAMLVVVLVSHGVRLARERQEP